MLCSSNTSNEGSNETLAGACLTCAVESSTVSEVVGIANYKHSHSCHGEVSMGRGGGGGGRGEGGKRKFGSMSTVGELRLSNYNMYVRRRWLLVC